MRLYWHPFSIFPRRVRIALREKAIDCEEVEVDLPGGAPRGAAFRRLNPFGQVPVLEDGEVVVFESIAILEYLEERWPRPALLPADPGGRARARQWMHASGDYFAPPLKRWLAQFFAPDQVDPADPPRASDELGAQLDVLASLLQNREHLLGAYSLADVCYAPFVCELAACRLGHLLADRPAIAAWVERLRARPALQATPPLPIA